ncbi:MAG: tetratricopeptide repeat protein [Candidatus Eremiobacteraeota bacterium]|nr:tetratricopeptide repeat protein [Candidatus Eremiobacteraeota bacterium]
MMTAGDVRLGDAKALAEAGSATEAAASFLAAAETFLNQESDIAKARAACSAALELDPHNVDITFLIGQADVIEGQNQRALVNFIDVIRRSNLKHVPALFETGCIYQANGQYDQAILAFKRTLDRDKGHVQAIVHIGQLHQTKGMLPEALRYYTQAAEVARESHQLGTARQLLHMVLALDSGQQRARHLLDDIADQWAAQAPMLVAPLEVPAGLAHGGLAAAQSADALEGRLPQVQGGLGEAILDAAAAGEQLGAQTEAALRVVQLEQQVAALQAALTDARASNASAREGGQGEVATDAALGHAALARLDYRTAADAFRAAVDANPFDADACFQLGCLLLDRFPDHRLAQQLLENALELRPHHMATSYALAIVRVKLGSVCSAVRSLTDQCEAQAAGALVLERFTERLEHDANEGDAWAKYALGIAYRELGRIDEALVVLQSTQREPGLVVLCLVAIGLCLRRQGLETAAVKRFKKAIQTPGYPEEQYNEALYNLGDLCETKTDSESLMLAVSSFEELYAQDCTYRDVAERIKNLNARLEAAHVNKLKWLPISNAEAANDR